MNMYFKAEDVESIISKGIAALDTDIKIAKDSDDLQALLRLFEVKKAITIIGLNIMDCKKYSDRRGRDGESSII